MCRKLLFVGAILLLLVGNAASPVSVRAEGDPLPTPEPVKPPWITGKNPNVSLSAGEEGELNPSGITAYWEGVEVPLLAAPPSYVDLAPQHVADNPPAVPLLAIPQRYQDPADVTCGAAALGMSLEFLSLNGEGNAPSNDMLVGDLKNSGLLYETGTGVEELACLARQHGYRGTTAFHNWTLEQLAEQLHLGKPIVVSLGANGAGKPGHFVTVTGVSADGKWVSYNDPILGAQTVPVHDFLKAWSLQGNSGLVVQKQPLSIADDPMLPWMGLLGALSTLAVLVKTNPRRTDLKETLSTIRGMLSNPLRKGLGGALIPEGGSSSSPPYTAPPGYKWKKTFTTKYGWKDVEIIEKVEVPNMVRTWAVVKVNRWMEKVPVYKSVKVDRGRWIYRTVTKYRTERYRTSERYRVIKSYWYRRNGRLYRGTRYEWKTRTVVKTRRVPYTKRERYWVPKIVTEQRIYRYRQIEHRDPVYGWREEKRGTKIIERTKTTRAWKPVGSEVKWKLERNPKPTSTLKPSITPSPPSILEPERAATPELTGTPFPVVSLPKTFPIHEVPSLIAKTSKWYKKGSGIWDASKLSYNPLDSGNFSVSAPGIVAGEKLAFRLGQSIPGTHYTPSALAKTTANSLLKKCNSGLGFSLVSSVGVNYYDYKYGEYSDIGVESNEFAASTAVDFAQAGLTGLAAAGAVAGGIALAGIAGITAVATAPLWAAALVAAGVGFGISLLVDHFVDKDKLKEDVTYGFETFPGIIDNVKTIVSMGAERLAGD